MSINGQPNFGLPPRPPTTSTPLWARILDPKCRLPSNLTEAAATIPLPAPLDKNATSMRILLHDTHANLEKFGEHVQKLIEGVKETKHEIKTTNTLFERDRESLVGDITDLINRSQKEIQKAIGDPATKESVQTLTKDVNGRLTELEIRISAISAFNQTHSQALQNQMKAVQILLDKQGSILTAVMPLLPLFQALPLHIDSAKTSICEHFTKTSAHLCPNSKSDEILTRTVAKEASSVRDSRKRKRADVGSSPSLSSPTPQQRTFSYKRMRTEHPAQSTPDSTNKSASSPTVTPSATSKLPAAQESSRPNGSASKIAPLGHQNPISTTTAAAATSFVSSTSHRSGGGTFTVPTFNTPLNRRPLTDLLPLPASRQNSRPTPRKKVLASVPPSSSGGIRDVSMFLDAKSGASSTFASRAQTPNIHRVNSPQGVRRASISSVHSSPTNGNGLSFLQRRSTAMPFTSPAITNPGDSKSSADRPVSRAAGNCLEATASPDVSRRPGIVSQDAKDQLVVAAGTGSSSDRIQASATELNDGAQNSALLNLERTNRNNIPILGKERWSPVREGRRFIALVDSEDEDEDT